MNLQNSLIYSLMQITIDFRNALQKSVNEIGLHSGQIFILIALWKDDGQRQIDLANILGVSAPTVNKMVGSLQRGDFVECRPDDDDGRVARVFLTDRGRAAEILTEQKWSELEAVYFTALTDTEQLILRQILEKLKPAVVPAGSDL